MLFDISSLAMRLQTHRLSQRRFVRVLDDDLVAAIAALPLPDVPGEEERLIIELTVRDMIAEEFGLVDDELIELLVERGKLDIIIPAFENYVRGVPRQSEATGNIGLWLSGRLAELSSRRDEIMRRRFEPTLIMKRLVALSLWADSLADDGYRDPRTNSTP